MRQLAAVEELGGVTLPRGARLRVLYASGSRDEAVFPQLEKEPKLASRNSL